MRIEVVWWLELSWLLVLLVILAILRVRLLVGLVLLIFWVIRITLIVLRRLAKVLVLMMSIVPLSWSPELPMVLPVVELTILVRVGHWRKVEEGRADVKLGTKLASLLINLFSTFFAQVEECLVKLYF